VKVPKDYWDLKRTDPKKAQEIIGIGYTVKKEDGTWWICEKIEKQENPDIADVYNTVLKIAKKRALVDATLTATAASDIFTQDLEESLPEDVKKATIVDQKEAPEPPKKAVGSLISHDMQLEVFRVLKQKNVDPDAFKTFLKGTIGVEGTAKIKMSDYEKVMEFLIKNERDAVES
jgi:hypothetical protein